MTEKGAESMAEIGGKVVAPPQDELASFEEATQAVHDFEALLRRHEIKIPSGSILEDFCLRVTEFAEGQKRNREGRRVWSDAEIRSTFLPGVGMSGVIQLVLKCSEHPEFGRLVPHLKLLEHGNPVQTVPSGVTDAAGNKLFELRLAMACLSSGKKLTLEDPTKPSKPANPDVLCTFEEDWRWGFACKVLHTDSPETLFGNVEKGVEQVERCASADVGVVVMSFKNRLKHDRIFPVLGRDGDGSPVYGIYPSPTQAAYEIARDIRNMVIEMVTRVDQQQIRHCFAEKKTLPAIVVPVDVCVGVEVPSGAALTMLSFIQSVPFVGIPWPEPESRCNHILDALNNGLVPNRWGSPLLTDAINRTSVVPWPLRTS